MPAKRYKYFNHCVGRRSHRFALAWFRLRRIAVSEEACVATIMIRQRTMIRQCAYWCGIIPQSAQCKFPQLPEEDYTAIARSLTITVCGVARPAFCITTAPADIATGARATTGAAAFCMPAVNQSSGVCISNHPQQHYGYDTTWGRSTPPTSAAPVATFFAGALAILFLFTPKLSQLFPIVCGGTLLFGRELLNSSSSSPGSRPSSSSDENSSGAIVCGKALNQLS